jgi:hypothetical protein
MGIAYIISIASWRLIINHPLSLLPQLVCAWRVLGLIRHEGQPIIGSVGLWVMCAKLAKTKPIKDQKRDLALMGAMLRINQSV